MVTTVIFLSLFIYPMGNLTFLTKGRSVYFSIGLTNYCNLQCITMSPCVADQWSSVSQLGDIWHSRLFNSHSWSCCFFSIFFSSSPLVFLMVYKSVEAWEKETLPRDWYSTNCRSLSERDLVLQCAALLNSGNAIISTHHIIYRKYRVIYPLHLSLVQVFLSGFCLSYPHIADTALNNGAFTAPTDCLPFGSMDGERYGVCLSCLEGFF